MNIIKENRLFGENVELSFRINLNCQDEKQVTCFQRSSQK